MHHSDGDDVVSEGAKRSEARPCVAATMMMMMNKMENVPSRAVVMRRRFAGDGAAARGLRG